MNYLAVLILLTASVSTASAGTFKLECLDADDGRTRLALIEVNTDAATIQVYSEADNGWKTAVNVSIAEATISYVAKGSNDASSPATSVTINRATGKYVAYTAHSPRKDGQCKKVS
jgi:hypothetical protein